MPQHTRCIRLRKSADRREPAVFAEFLAAFIERFHNAIGVQDESIAGVEFDAGSLMGAGCCDSQRESAGAEKFQITRVSTEHRRVVSGIHILDGARRGIIFGEHRRREAQATEAVTAGVAVEPCDHLLKRCALARDGPQARLQRGHEQRRRNALSRDIRDYNEQLASVRGARGGIKRIVIVARDRVLRPCGKGHFGAGNLRRRGRNQPGLDLSRDFQVALHRHAVSQLQHQKEEEQERREKLKIDIKIRLASKLHVQAGQNQHPECDEEEDAPRR